jgi:N-methylhydantoinase A/oxoprolinase/acetone carboxylase beta subunit
MVRRSDYDDWVIEWIEKEKENGRKCFDVKRIGNCYYLYYQTTRYNSETKKREKVSKYIGKLTRDGVDENGKKEDDFVSQARYGLGVDTGGTFTDAVIVDLDDYSIIAKKKSPTTHDDLSIGLYNSVDAVLTASGIDPSQITSVGISTTLATNSILEGKGGKVGLILIGWDPMNPVQFGEDKQIFIRGGYDVNGKAKNSLSLEETTAAIEEISKDVDAIAISGLFANVNATQERKVKKLAIELTGLPTVAGHELSAELGIGLRAETAVLNGKLVSIVAKFFDDVQRTFESKGINAPIMVYKCDGSVMTLEQAKQYPVQTILSGPAASSMGGCILSNKKNFVMVDIGGTSTDIAVMEGGFPQIQYKGAEVGGWRTRVKAVDMHTIALGGDSRISTRDSKFFFGPNRVIPLCRFTEEHPEIIDDILHSGLCDYYIVKDDCSTKDLNEREIRILNGMRGKGALNRMEAMEAADGLWNIDDDLTDMVNKGVLTMSSLTPTDLMVYLGHFEMGNLKGAEAGITAMAEKFGMSVKQAAGFIMEEAKSRVAEAVMTKLINDRMDDWQCDRTAKLLRRMSTANKNVDTFEMRPTLKVPIVGIGAPAKYLMEDIDKRLGCKSIFPEDCDVGNALGAISSKVVESLSAMVTPTHDFRFKLEVPYLGPSYYSNIDSAISAGRSSLESFLKDEVKKKGGVNIYTSTKIKTVMANEGGYGNWEDEATARNVTYVEILSRAIGDPPEVN